MTHGLSTGQGKPVYQWSKAIEVGHAEIDAEHRRWLDYLNELRDAAEGADRDTVIRKSVDDLRSYVAMHFAHEERIMDGFDYDERERHKRAHRAFTRKCDEIEREKSSNREICEAISLFIYDWLVSHIASVDRVMVAKLDGRFQATFTGDDTASQTHAVIDGAFTVAGLVEQTSVRLGSARGRLQRVKLARELANASERLTNLIELAQMRVEVFGCTDFELDRLRGMKEAVATSVRAQLVTTVGRLIDYGSAIVAGRHGLPFGVGAALTRQVARIGMLIRIVGGFGELDDRLADRVAQATDITNEVVGIEARALAMPNFHASVKTERKGMGSVGDAKDDAFVVMAQKASRKIADLLETAVDTNRVGLEDLFDEGYMPIEGTNPQQYKTQFLALADQLFPEVQEAVLADNESIVFAVAVDRNGYLPTHNRKYSLPQGDNPVWNAAHCRNRRIFDDKCGLAAARNLTPILLQTYLRDTGGGEIAILRDASSPITVKGRHWGAFRVAYPIGDV